MIMRMSILCMVSLIAFDASAQTLVEDLYTSDGDHSPISLVGGQKCAQRFTATLPFEGIQVNGPTWSVSGEKGLTIRLYEWAGSYSATIVQDPITVSVLVDLTDNDWWPCYAGSELPPGEYMWEASEPTNSNPEADNPHQIGCWLENGSKYTGGEAYFNGEPYGEVAVEWKRVYSEAQSDDDWYPFPFSGADNPTLAQSFTFPSESIPDVDAFQAVGIASPTWNGSGAGYRMVLYKWDTDYDTTVAGTPIAEETFSNISDNARNELVLDSPLGEGKYLVFTDQPVLGSNNSVGHWGWNNSLWWDDENAAYQDGVEIETGASFDLFLGVPSEEVVGKDFASRTVTGVATAVNHWELY